MKLRRADLRHAAVRGQFVRATEVRPVGNAAQGMNVRFGDAALPQWDGPGMAAMGQSCLWTRTSRTHRCRAAASLPRGKQCRSEGLRFPREVIACAVGANHRFALNPADVKDLLVEQGVIGSREAIRLRVNRFGAQVARYIRRGAVEKWHLVKVVIAIKGVKNRPWRPDEAYGDVLDIRVQPRRKPTASQPFTEGHAPTQIIP